MGIRADLFRKYESLPFSFYDTHKTGDLIARLKAADVKLCVFYGPPSQTNFGGGLLTGTQSACEAACQAFRQAVEEVARFPK